MRENGFHPGKSGDFRRQHAQNLAANTCRRFKRSYNTYQKSDAPLLGCAILSAVGAGFYQDIPQLSDYGTNREYS
ncbi:MAG: hypothetical protein CM1200mP30_30260 [Pseudomonadota bacterium]|nr:MAG: hypothetical protein CM1200mP30_30260 [Pseudomonadota bacterium]